MDEAEDMSADKRGGSQLSKDKRITHDQDMSEDESENENVSNKHVNDESSKQELSTPIDAPKLEENDCKKSSEESKDNASETPALSES
jgi:hypothetical protein